MYDKRATWVVAGLASVAVLAGCASTKEGNGSFAGGPVGPTSASSSPTPTQQPTPTATPSSSAEPSVVPTTPPQQDTPTADRTVGNVDIEDDGAICQLISPAQLQQIFGEKPRLFPDSGGPGCTYKNANGDQIIIDEYANLVASEQLAEDKKYKTEPYTIKSTTIGGRPAKILLDSGDFGDGYIYVSETSNFAADGVVEALVNNDPNLQRISKALLALVVPKYAR